ncbi:unnamed protein product [Peniophora sp. CBMAI 1063]|nr:unnamed protein product [Peniophora sp. CBMAI 1063]
MQRTLHPPPLDSQLPTDTNLTASFNNSQTRFTAEKTGDHHAYELPSDADALDFLDASRSINTAQLTAIIPVSTTSLHTLAESIPALHTNYQLAEVVLLVLEEDLVAVRRELRTVMDKRLWEDASLSLTLRVREGGLVDDVLKSAAQSSSKEVLIMTGDATAPLDLKMLDVTLPAGLRGFLQGKCVTPASAQQTVDYLVPPLLLPVQLARKLEGWGMDSWSALGSGIAMLHGGSFGGIVLAASDSHSEDAWCSGSSPAYPVDAHYSDANSLLLEANQLFIPVPANTTAARIASFGIVMPSIHDLKSFSPVICGLKASGYSVNVLLQASTVLRSESGNIQTDSCSIPYTMADSPTGVSSWVECFVFDVLISAIDAHHLIPAGHGRFTLISILREDLPYSDWMCTLSLKEWQNWNTPHVELSIITDSRPTSLERLFNSLLAARYYGDSVSLRINVEQAADAETLALIERYSAQWIHGSVFVHHRVVAGGLLPAVVESWYPSSNDSYGILLEDDVEVSPLFYAWAKHALLRYRYGDERMKATNLFGISLYSPKNLELRPAGRVSFDAHAVLETAGYARDTPYLSQVPCSWGALYFPEHWREFHAYLPPRLKASNTVVVPNARSNRWARSWKRFFIELAYVRGYAMLYPNYESGRAFSTNHLEHGAHVKPLPPREWERKKALFEVPLVGLPEAGAGTGLLDMPGGGLPRWEGIPLLDLFGEVVVWDIALERGIKRRREVWGCEGTGRPFDARDLMCA